MSAAAQDHGANHPETPETKPSGMTLLAIIKSEPDLVVIDQFDRWTNPTDARCDCSSYTICCVDFSTARSVA